MKKLWEKVTTSQKDMFSQCHNDKNAHTTAPGTAKYANLRCIYTGLCEYMKSVFFVFRPSVLKMAVVPNKIGTVYWLKI